MKVDEFLENFELLADAPNAVAKLRELILQFAARGKLVQQYQSDEPASVLINQITTQRNSLRLQSEIKDEKVLPGISSEKALHPIPSNWIWTYLGEVVNYSGAKKVLPDEIPETSWLLELEDIEKDTSQIITKKTFGEKNSKSTKAKFKSGDILYGKLRPYLNKVLVADADGYCTTEIVPLQPYQGIIPKYVMYILKRPDFLSYVNSKTYGINLPRLGTEDGRKAIFPLPPTEEQKRIVEKCDRLLSFCNQIEVKQRKRQESIVRINESVIAQLLSSQNPDEFSQHWEGICNNFDLLYSVPETIPKLRQAILQLAVQGKLVRQDPNDEPASILLERIKTDKLRLTAEGLIRKFEPLLAVATDNAPFELPKGWTWARFPELGEFGRGKSKHRPRNDLKLYEEGNYPLVQTGDVARSNGLITTYTGLYNDIGLAQSRLWSKGTLCITIAANIAASGILSFDACIPDSVVGFVPSKELGDAQYFEYFMRTAKEYLQNYAPSTAQKNINLAILEKVLIPLPPLAEQKCIVAKVDHLMSLCNTLEVKLKDARSYSELLMEVAAKQLLTV